MALDTKSNRLFLFSLNRNTLEYSTEIVGAREGLSVPLKAPMPNFRFRLINIDGEIHRISYSVNATHHHTIWNDAKQIWEPIKNTPAFAHKGAHGPRNYTLIHVPSKKIILMIGGGIYSGYFKNDTVLWKYHIETQLWEPIKSEKFELCPKLQLMIPGYLNDDFILSSIGHTLAGCPAVLSSDESSVIILSSTHFLVLDIRDDDQYTLRQSDVSLQSQIPEFDEEYKRIVRCGGGCDALLLAKGWIRRQIALHVPREIVRLAATWCSTEMIHVIGGASFHKKVSMDSILRGSIECDDSDSLIVQ